MNTTASNPISKGQASLIKELIDTGVLKSREVANAMLSVDRGYYSSGDPYEDCPQSIGYRATISAPHMHAFALELLKDQLANGTKCLDVGSGSGYLTVCFAKMMKKQGAVAYGIEHIPELVRDSIENIRNSPDKDLLDSGKVVIREGDGRKGLKEFAPFDAIHVGAGAEKLPEDLVDQLAKGGRMIIPVGNFGEQDYLVVDKGSDGKVETHKVLSVAYVPLTDKEKQWPGNRR